MESVSMTEKTEQQEKTFTQEEVNEIIKKRLYDRKKEKEEAQITEEDFQKREKDIKDREESISKRENRMKCCEIVVDRGYSMDLIDILDTSNPEEFEVKADKIYNLRKNKTVPPAASSEHPEPTISAFSNSKHVPKTYG